MPSKRNWPSASPMCANGARKNRYRPAIPTVMPARRATKMLCVGRGDDSSRSRSPRSNSTSTLDFNPLDIIIVISAAIANVTMTTSCCGGSPAAGKPLRSRNARPCRPRNRNEKTITARLFSPRVALVLLAAAELNMNMRTSCRSSQSALPGRAIRAVPSGAGTRLPGCRRASARAVHRACLLRSGARAG